MRIKKYLDKRNWYLEVILLLLERQPGECPPVMINDTHEVREVTESNVADSQAFEAKEYTDTYKKFLRHGDIGIFGYVQGKCAARCWGGVRPVDVKAGDTNLGLEEDAVFVHYVETDPEHRREGLGREILGRLVEICHEQKMYVTINMNNIPSLKLHKKYGFREIGVIRVRRRWRGKTAQIYRFDKKL